MTLQKRYYFIVLLLIIFLLCGCTKSDSAIDVNYWKEKLKDDHSKENIIDKTQEAAQDLMDKGVDTASGLYEMLDSHEGMNKDFFQNIGDSIANLFKQWSIGGQNVQKETE